MIVIVLYWCQTVALGGFVSKHVPSICCEFDLPVHVRLIKWQCRVCRRGCLQLFPFRLIIDRSQPRVSVVQRSPPPPTCLCVHTCVKVCGGLYSGRMWNWRRTITDRWWDCASDPVHVRSAVQRRNKGHTGGGTLVLRHGHVLNICLAWQWKYRRFLKTICRLRSGPGLTVFLT